MIQVKVSRTFDHKLLNNIFYRCFYGTYGTYWYLKTDNLNLTQEEVSIFYMTIRSVVMECHIRINLHPSNVYIDRFIFTLYWPHPTDELRYANYGIILLLFLVSLCRVFPCCGTLFPPSLTSRLRRSILCFLEIV